MDVAEVEEDVPLPPRAPPTPPRRPSLPLPLLLVGVDFDVVEVEEEVPPPPRSPTTPPRRPPLLLGVDLDVAEDEEEVPPPPRVPPTPPKRLPPLSLPLVAVCDGFAVRVAVVAEEEEASPISLLSPPEVPMNVLVGSLAAEDEDEAPPLRIPPRPKSPPLSSLPVCVGSALALTVAVPISKVDEDTNEDECSASEAAVDEEWEALVAFSEGLVNEDLSEVAVNEDLGVLVAVSEKLDETEEPPAPPSRMPLLFASLLFLPADVRVNVDLAVAEVEVTVSNEFEEEDVAFSLAEIPPRSPPLPCVVVAVACDVSALDVVAEASADDAGAFEDATLSVEAAALDVAELEGGMDASAFEDVATLDASIFAEVVGAAPEPEDSLDETPLSLASRFSK